MKIGTQIAAVRAGCEIGMSHSTATEHQISERGRALIIAAAVLDRPSADPDDDIAVLARQLRRAHEEVEQLMRDVKRLRCAKL